MDEEEVRWSAFSDLTGFDLAEDFARLPGDGRDCLPRLEPRLGECFHLPSELVRACGAAAEVSAGAKEHTGGVRKPDTVASRLPTLGDPLASLRAREALDRRRPAEARPGLEHRQRRNQRDSALCHHLGAILVELESVLDAVNPSLYADTAAAEPAGVRGHLRSPLVGGADYAPHLVGRPGCRVGVRPVEVELHEVRALVELRPCQRSRSPRLSARLRPSTGSTPTGAPTSLAQRIPACVCSFALCSACRSSRSGASPPRSIQCDPPGRVR